MNEEDKYYGSAECPYCGNEVDLPAPYEEITGSDIFCSACQEEFAV